MQLDEKIKLLALTSPVKGITNPAPTDIDMWLIGKVKPVGAPLTVGSAVRDNGVFAIQTGKVPKP